MVSMPHAAAAVRVVSMSTADVTCKLDGMQKLAVGAELPTGSYSQALLMPTCDYCNTTAEMVCITATKAHI